MNKKLIAVFLILGVTVFIARYVYIRSYGIHLSAARFIEKAGDRDGAGSMYSLRYDGVREGRAYLYSWDMGQAPESMTYWTEIDALPVHIRNQMLSKTGRWKMASQKNRLEEQEK